MPVKVVITILILLFSVPNTLFGQTGSTTSDKFRYAVEQYDRNNFERALSQFKSITDRYCSAGAYRELCLESLFYKSAIVRNNNQFEKAKEMIDRAEEFVINAMDAMPDPLAVVYQQQIYVLTEEDNYEEAEYYADQLRIMLETEDLQPLSVLKGTLGIGFYDDLAGDYENAIEVYKYGLAAIENIRKDREVRRALIQAYTNLGVSYRKLGQPEEAMEMYLLSVNEINELYGDDHLSLAYSYNNIGGIYYGKGDYGRASDYFIRAAAIMERGLGKTNHRLGAAYNNAGVSMFMLGNLDKAAEYLEEAQRVKEATVGLNHIDTAVGYSNLASIHLSNKDYDEAERNYRLSIQVRKNIHGDNHPILIEPKTQFASFLIEMERYEEAEFSLHRALDVALDRLGPKHPNVADLYLTLGNSRKLQGIHEEAVDYFSRAFQVIYGSFDFSEEMDLMRTIVNPRKAVEILQTWADAYWSLYNQNPHESNLHEAKSILKWAMDLVDHLQHSYKSEASKLNLVDKNYALYTNKAEILYEFYKINKDEYYLDRLFRVIEQSRSRIALELLQNLTARSFAGVPEEVVESERELNAKISNLFQQLSTEQQKGTDIDRELVASLQDTLFYTKRELERFMNEVEDSYPSYYLLKYDRQVISENDAAKLLGDTHTLINFIAGEENIHAMLISSGTSDFIRLAETAGMEEKVTGLRDAVVKGKTADYTKSAYQLYQELIEPLAPYLDTESLIIVADQMLHFLPFELLLTEDVLHQRYEQMPFLVNEFNISYAPSVTILEKMLERKKESPKNLLALAPFTDVEMDWNSGSNPQRYGDQMEPLLLTNYETRKIGEIFRQRRSLAEYFFPNQTEILLSKNATKAEFLSRLGNYNYLHFATHAFINEENPAMSGIALYPGADDDGIAYVGDIYDMELNADLVVLGACDTGLGSVYRGEGLIGFTRAFIYAGAANLTVSMWRVNDQPTAQLMIYFYENIREGYSYSESLRQAKLSMIENPATAAPRNWAAFVLHGM